MRSEQVFFFFFSVIIPIIFFFFQNFAIYYNIYLEPAAVDADGAAPGSTAGVLAMSGLATRPVGG